MVNSKELSKETSEFRKKKIKQPIKNEIDYDIKEEFIKEERGEEIKIDKKSLEAIRDTFYIIKDVLQKYLVMKENYYDICALWIIGTYFHDEFQSFPYLFFNAMKGSGKSRALKLITCLSKDGKMMASPTEAVLFRTKGTLGIDEFEAVANKDKGSIRELLNASYKKGTKVFRMKKKKTLEGEEQVAEEFETYRPIVIANISGMDEVLGDRCIAMVLERSNDPSRTKLIEDFSTQETIQNIKKNLTECSLCSVVTIKNIQLHWNNYITHKYSYSDEKKTTLYTYYTYTTLTTLTTQQQLHNIEINTIFNKIDDSGIYGRNLELFMPLFLISYTIDKFFLLDKIIEIAKELTDEKNYDQQIEDYDILVIEFVSKFEPSMNHYYVKDLSNKFRSDYELDHEDINAKWFGKALKRLSLLSNKRRRSKGVEVLLNIGKAKEKIKMFQGDKTKL